MTKTILAPTEYNEYYKRYIDHALEKPLLEGLQEGMLATLEFFKGIPEEKHVYRYELGKWTPKEILLHLIDTERVFVYRAMQFARAKDVVIKGFDQEEFATNSRANDRTMNELLDEYTAVRAATIQFTKSCDEETLLRKGIASKSNLSVRAALYIVVGHEVHHATIITEKYL